MQKSARRNDDEGPYLTHVIKHHGRVTLVPPENAGRRRLPKTTRRRHELPSAASSGDLALLATDRSPSGSRPSSVASSSSRNKLTKKNDAGNFVYLRPRSRPESRRGDSAPCRSERPQTPLIAIHPPAHSGDAASAARPSLQASQSSPSILGADEASSSRLRANNPLTSDSADRTSRISQSPRPASYASSSSSLSSPPSTTRNYVPSPFRAGQVQWEADRAAGLSLDERVSREFERLQLGQSSPPLPSSSYISTPEADCEAAQRLPSQYPFPAHASLPTSSTPPSISISTETSLAENAVGLPHLSGSQSASSRRSSPPPRRDGPASPNVRARDHPPSVHSATQPSPLSSPTDEGDASEDSDSSRASGMDYDTLLAISEIIGPATAVGTDISLESAAPEIPLGLIEVQRRRVTKEGHVKLKLALLGVRLSIDKCGICLCQFKEGASAYLLRCQHAFHEQCLKKWLPRSGTCPLCRLSIEDTIRG